MVVITMHVHHPLVFRPRAPRLPSLRGLGAAARAVAVPGSVTGGAPALHARVVQERLVAHRYLAKEAVTGRYDRATLDAVARFQAEQQLPVDGVPEARTADALSSPQGRSSSTSAAPAARAEVVARLRSTFSTVSQRRW